MAEEQDIKIKIATETDNKGTDSAVAGLKKVEDQAKKTAAATNKAEGNGGFGGQLDGTSPRTDEDNEKSATIVDKLTDAIKKNKDGTGESIETAKKWSRTWHDESIAAANAVEKKDLLPLLKKLSGGAATEAAVVSASMAAIAASAVWAGNAINETITGYSEEIAKAKAAGLEITPEFEAQIKSYQDLFSPITGTINAIKTAWDNVTAAISNPADFFSGLGEFRKWEADTLQFLETAKKYQAEFLQKRLESNQQSILETYERETTELQRHLALTQQINQTRASLADIAVQRANNQVKIAEQDGGDVAAAQANALLVSLNSSLANLQGGIKETKDKVDAAYIQSTDANIRLNAAIQDGGSKELIAKLEKEVEDKDATFRLLDQGLTDQKNIIREKGKLIAENAEIALVDLQDKYGEALSKAAQEGIAAVQGKIQEVASSPEVANQADAIANQLQTKATGDAQKLSEVAASVEPIAAAQQQSLTALQASLGSQAQLSELLRTGFQGVTQNLDKCIAIMQNIISQQQAQSARISEIASGISNR